MDDGGNERVFWASIYFHFSFGIESISNCLCFCFYLVDTPSPDGVQLLFVQFDIIVLYERQLLYSYYRICLNAKGTKGILTVIKLLVCTSRHKQSTKVNTWSTTVVFPGFVHIIRKFKCAALRGRWCAAKTYLISSQKSYRAFSS